jgi:DNA-binding IclR family transcriptional regulator/uncharacterized OsmC-like protein
MNEPDQTASDLLFNQSLEKGLAVLRAFDAQHRTMTLGDVASATGMSKSSAQRMVHTLEMLGYVCKHPKTRRYQLTPKVMEVGYNYLAADILVDVANPFLSELANITGETVNLTEPYDCEMVYVARFVASKFIPIHMPIGSRIPMYCTASGRAYLSGLDPAEARAIWPPANARSTRRTPVPTWKTSCSCWKPAANAALRATGKSCSGRHDHRRPGVQQRASAGGVGPCGCTDQSLECGRCREEAGSPGAGVRARHFQFGTHAGVSLVTQSPVTLITCPTETPMAHVTLHNAAGYAQDIKARIHQLKSDEPESNGGKDTGPAPYELLLAALASCTSLTLRMYADRKGWDLGSISVDAHFGRDDSGLETITRKISFGNALSQEQLTRLAEICEKTPVTKTIRQGTAIQTSMA